MDRPMIGREQGAPKPIRHALGTVTSAEGTRLSSSNRPDQAAKYGGEQGEAVEARTPGSLHLEDGTTWPCPEPADDDPGPEWRARYAPGTVTREDLLWLAEVSHAYRRLVHVPAAGKQLPMVRRALAERSPS